MPEELCFIPHTSIWFKNPEQLDQYPTRENYVKPRKLNEAVWLAGGETGEDSVCALTYAMELNNGKIAVVDPGPPEGYPQLIENLVTMFPYLRPCDVSILLTHAHYDHAGCLDYLPDEIAVYASHETIRILREGNPYKNCADFYGRHFPPVEREITCLEDLNQDVSNNSKGVYTVTIEDEEIKVIDSAGHSPDQVSYTFDRHKVVALGDLFWGMYSEIRIGSNIYSWQKSLNRIIQHCFVHTDYFLPGHVDPAYLPIQSWKLPDKAAEFIPTEEEFRIIDDWPEGYVCPWR